MTPRQIDLVKTEYAADFGFEMDAETADNLEDIETFEDLEYAYDNDLLSLGAFETARWVLTTGDM